MAPRGGRLSVTAARRRGALVIALAAVVALLVGGRWTAVEVAERTWATSVAHGEVYLAMRDLARLVHGVVLLVAVTWGVGNLYRVYRTIGSVQLPRRLGDLEIVEEVPHRVLLGTTLATGLLYGLLLALGSGNWWLRAGLAAQPPHFGVSDPVLGRDLGYYLGELPWVVTCERFAFLAATTALLIAGALYVGIGSLRLRGWRLIASAHARGHLGFLLAILAGVCVWGSLLDPARAVGGMHSVADLAAVGVRLVGARVTAALAVAAGGASLWWIARERAEPMLAGWALFLIALVALDIAALGMGHAPVEASDRERAQLEERALGGDWRDETWPPGFPSGPPALAAIPIWDPARVATVAARTWGVERTVATLVASNGARATWLVVPMPAGSGHPPDASVAEAATPGSGVAAGRPELVTEVDSSLAFAPAPVGDSTLWFGPGVADFALAPPSATALRESTVSLDSWWRRIAFAWVLQSPELVRGSGAPLLVWRRDASARLERLAPFASFAPPVPMMLDSTLIWVAYGYDASDVFPLVRALPWRDGGGDVRYLHLAVIGTVAAATGATDIYLAPGADSLAAAWARMFAPLIRPTEALPPIVRARLPFPAALFTMAAAALERVHADSDPWHPLAREPYQLAAPLAGPESSAVRLWSAMGFEVGAPPRLAALLAGTVTPAGPRLYIWTPTDSVRGPAELLGSPETAPGVLRMWSADGELFTEQALFDEPAAGGAPKGVSQVYLTWGDREGQGSTAGAALRALESGPTRSEPADTSVAGRWDAARRLAVAADSALAAGDLVGFARHYAELERVLGVRRLAPPMRSR